VNGLVTALTAGTTTITATTEDGAKTATCDISVSSNIALSLNRKDITLSQIGQTVTLVPTIASGVTWTSSDPAIATVANGIVTAAGNGTATITVTLGSGASVKTASCAIKVDTSALVIEDFEDNAYTFTVSSEKSIINDVSLAYDGSYAIRLNATVDYQGIEYALNNSSGGGTKTYKVSALVRGDGAAAALRYSTTYTDTTTHYDQFAAITAPADSYVLLEGTVEVPAGRTTTVKLAPQNAATAKYFVDNFVIQDLTAPKAINSISLNKDSTTLAIGEEEALTVTFNPSDATTSKTITWVSDHPDIASVDSVGKVTAVAAGTAVITAKSAIDGVTTSEYTDICTVTVSAVVAMTIDRKNVVIPSSGATIQLHTNKTGTTWATNNSSVATVSTDGLVSAVGDGTAIITATAGAMSVTCNVIVNSKAILVEDFEDSTTDSGITQPNGPSFMSIVSASIDSVAAYDGDKCLKVNTGDAYNGIQYTITNNTGSTKQYRLTAWVRSAAEGSINLYCSQEGGGYTDHHTVSATTSSWVQLDSGPITVASAASYILRIKAKANTWYYVDNFMISDVTVPAPTETVINDTSSETYGLTLEAGSYIANQSIDGVNKVLVVSGSAITSGYKIASIYLGDSYVGKTVKVTVKIRRTGIPGNLAWQMYTTTSTNFAVKWSAAVDTWYTIEGTAVVPAAGELYLSKSDAPGTTFYIADFVVTLLE
jgi:uncharacterized protein YjdB